MRKALVVGINDYPGNARLRACINDANLIGQLLSTHEDGTPNFDVMLSLDVKSKSTLRSLILNVFNNEDEISLFYFSGHGCINELGGYIITPDFNQHDAGISMDDILKMASLSKALHKIIILDCCHAGAMGTPAFAGNTAAYLEKGVTILASSRNTESSVESDGQGVFTSLLADALNGGGADIGGEVTPGNIYGYIDKALGNWSQRPVFKSNIMRSVSLRKVSPFVPLPELRKLTFYFETVDSEFPLDPSYEFTSSEPHIEHISIFKSLRRMQLVRLIEPVGEEYMYYAAINNKSCRLTSLGKYYWKLVHNGRL